MEKQKIIIIQGPTGVGKTGIALSLAKTVPVEIINADSMQFYRYMDIGTSKPTTEEQKTAPHHLFSIINPDETFNAAGFMSLGRQAISEIINRGNVPLVVGGTGLYIKSLTKGLFTSPKVDEDLRDRLKKEPKKSLFEKLCRFDPEASQRIKPNDIVRIIRALEVYYLSGESLTEHQNRHRFQDSIFNCLKICLNRDRKSLYERIERRVDQMMDRGLLQEVMSLAEMGYSLENKSFQSIGYRQIKEYILGEISFSDAVLNIKRDTKRLAKRQLTWFRRDPEAIWINLPDGAGGIEALTKNFLNIA